ncbi:MAG: C25 family cysteine peptidase [Candidatus Eisenbacteria bacterium]
MRRNRDGATGSGVGRILAVVLVGMFLFMAAQAGAAVVYQRYEFDAPQVVRVGQYDHIVLQGAWSYGEPGEPVLPKAGVQLVLPPGEEVVSVNVIGGEKVELAGQYYLAPGQRQYPLTYTGTATPDAPLPAIYASDAAFPGKLHEEPQTGLLRGYQIASLVLHPVEYAPQSGRLAYYRNLDVEIVTAPSEPARLQTEEMIRHDAATLARVRAVVDNPPAVADYAGVPQNAPRTRALDPALAYKYLIVTADAWAGYLDPLVAFETERGFKTGVFLKSWISANYTGADEQTKIRNFIIDAYGTWGVDYVLLVGDARDATNGILHRGLYAVGYGLGDDDIPADMYYGCLDGNWNTDGDSYWGEASEADLYFEVGIGRACIDSATELQNFITKTMRYQQEPVVEECDEALMVGELLWDDPTYGDDYKEEVRTGSSAYGYTTVGFPGTMEVGTLYDRSGTWSKTTLINLMETGMNIVNHLGHCNVTYAMRMYNTDIPSFDNDGTTHSYNFVYSQGCYCGSFDNRTDSETYTDDCFAEQFVADDDGAVAVVMNSRYGWGEHESTNGSSQYFDRQFFDAIFGEHIYALADVNDDSKMDNVWSISYGANRWCYYELNVFGDPAMHLWTAEPDEMECMYPPTVFIGAADFAVSVSKPGGMPLQGARVTIYTEDYAVHDSGVTDAFGEVTLHPYAEGPGMLHIQVTAHDYLPHTGTSVISAPSGPYVVFDSHVVQDDEGDQDGEADAGEALGIDLTLENVGVDPATAVTVTLASADPQVNILTPTRAFPNLPAGGFGTSVAPFDIEIAAITPDQHVVAFTFQATSAEGQWSGGFNMLVAAPVLACGELLVSDNSGNGDGGADPGETVYLQIWLNNTGHSSAPALEGTLFTSESVVAILDGQAGSPGFDPQEPGLLGTFEVQVLPGCPDPTTLQFQIDLTAANGFEAELDLVLDVGGWFDPAENDRGWTFGTTGDGATSGIWLRAEPVGTTENTNQVQPEYDHTVDPGELCFVTGNASAGQSSGTNDVDGGKTTLLSPVFDLSEAVSASVEYWRWYTNNLGNNPGQDYWNVDITANGTDWVSLEHTLTSATSWNQYTFDVGSFVALTDHIQMRFIAEDASPGSLVEAAVDDFVLDVVLALPSGLTVEEVREGYGILSYGPNPFGRQSSLVYRLARASAVRIDVYDVTGRSVRTLVDGPVEAGTHALAFDGLDRGGHALTSGIYFLRMETPEMFEVRQVTIMR